MEVNSLTPYSRSLYLHCLPSPITQISTSYWFILIIIKTCCHFLHIKKIRIKTFIDLSQLCSPVWEKVHVGILYLFSSYLISYYLFLKKITFGCTGFSSVVERDGGHSPAVVRALLIVVASLAAEHGLSCSRGMWGPP